MKELFSKEYRQQLVLGVCLAIGFECTLIEVLSCYSVDILETVENMENKTAITWSFIMTLVECLGNFLAIFVVDKVGKKMML